MPAVTPEGRKRRILQIYNEVSPTKESHHQTCQAVVDLATFDTSVSTVDRIVRGVHRPRKTRRPTTIERDEAAVAILENLQSKDSTLYVREMHHVLTSESSLNISRNSVRRQLHRDGWSRKRTTRRRIWNPADGDRVADHLGVLANYDPADVWFLDETMVEERDFLRRFAWAQKGAPATKQERVGHASHGITKFSVTNLCNPVHGNFIHIHECTEGDGGGSGGPQFLQFWVEPSTFPGVTPLDAIPAHCGQLVVMDNVKFHLESNGFGAAISVSCLAVVLMQCPGHALSEWRDYTLSTTVLPMVQPKRSRDFQNCQGPPQGVW
eukprot:CAMPEP_0175922574 /NCGR_PEP_ID=MMETSP0108-20121206/14118_1 /TAXON_ID=195067 ORGANISM="Goniomonas pacifica, Strain CCMP1869" /NCGR_SAMPLE_ID=MMETSP0108 /ASSEMBLY_ACC=CAM_ASM_000204 /LENGTH=322 /DNA_ID=CAMNT_0017245533 /DNA_START=53 /DNA_END=1018 /DNA_ORIENTATION=-